MKEIIHWSALERGIGQIKEQALALDGDAVNLFHVKFA